MVAFEADLLSNWNTVFWINESYTGFPGWLKKKKIYQQVISLGQEIGVLFGLLVYISHVQTK